MQDENGKLLNNPFLILPEETFYCQSKFATPVVLKMKT